MPRSTKSLEQRIAEKEAEIADLQQKKNKQVEHYDGKISERTNELNELVLAKQSEMLTKIEKKASEMGITVDELVNQLTI